MTIDEAEERLSEARAMAVEARSPQTVSNSFVTILVEPQADAAGKIVRVIYRVNGRQSTLVSAAVAMVKA
ncbi:MAG: hypothetical protein EOP82_21620 [Variovorax sp.]|nr:MAG: hypothetical protein EOP82_21620 [Variovorax sp.]